jgi:hypothetical protein
MSGAQDAHASTLALFALCVGIWSSTWLAITFQLGHVAPPYRFLLASLLLSGWCGARGVLGN